MKSRFPAVEAVLIALSLGSFILYHVWFFLLRPCISRKAANRYYGINGKGKLARLIFSQIVSTDPKASILGVQQSRCAKVRPECFLLQFSGAEHSCMQTSAH